LHEHLAGERVSAYANRVGSAQRNHQAASFDYFYFHVKETYQANNEGLN